MYPLFHDLYYTQITASSANRACKAAVQSRVVLNIFLLLPELVKFQS